MFLKREVARVGKVGIAKEGDSGRVATHPLRSLS